jgi:hypothetical protein
MSYLVGSLMEVSSSPIDPATGSSTPPTAPRGPVWPRPIADPPRRTVGSPPHARIALRLCESGGVGWGGSRCRTAGIRLPLPSGSRAPTGLQRPRTIELPREAEPSLTSPPPGEDGGGEHDAGVDAAQDAPAPLQHKLEAAASVSSPRAPSCLHLLWNRVRGPPHVYAELGSRCRRPSVRSSSPGAETCSPTAGASEAEHGRWRQTHRLARRCPVVGAAAAYLSWSLHWTRWSSAHPLFPPPDHPFLSHGRDERTSEEPHLHRESSPTTTQATRMTSHLPRQVNVR